MLSDLPVWEVNILKSSREGSESDPLKVLDLIEALDLIIGWMELSTLQCFGDVFEMKQSLRFREVIETHL